MTPREQREHVHEEELLKFRVRVGATPKARLQWALDFARRNLAEMTDGDWSNLRRELEEFKRVLITPDAVDTPWVLSSLSGEGDPNSRERDRPGMARAASLTPWRSAAPAGYLYPLRTDGELQQIQREWRDIFQPLLRPGGEAKIGPFELRITLWRHKDGSEFRKMLPAADDQHGRLHVAMLLGAYVDLIAECPEASCRRWFVASRKRQEFCSRACQNRASIRAWRAVGKGGKKPKR